MGKNKLFRFAQNETFENVFQPNFYEVQEEGFPLKGKWRQEYFGNDNPITLELGCGKGEYTIAMAKRYPERNFIGVDIKGARFWRGARTAVDEGIKNVAFLRTRIDQIPNFFDKSDLVNEIWVTFPDPQPRESKIKKRLTGVQMVNRYRTFLSREGSINLKSDDDMFYEFTLETVKENHWPLLDSCPDIYGLRPDDELLAGVQTFYERMWLEMGKKIKYVKFRPFRSDEE